MDRKLTSLPGKLCDTVLHTSLELLIQDVTRLTFPLRRYSVLSSSCLEISNKMYKFIKCQHHPSILPPSSRFYSTESPVSFLDFHKVIEWMESDSWAHGYKCHLLGTSVFINTMSTRLRKCSRTLKPMCSPLRNAGIGLEILSNISFSTAVTIIDDGQSARYLANLDWIPIRDELEYTGYI